MAFHFSTSYTARFLPCPPSLISSIYFSCTIQMDFPWWKSYTLINCKRSIVWTTLRICIDKATHILPILCCTSSPGPLTACKNNWIICYKIVSFELIKYVVNSKTLYAFQTIAYFEDWLLCMLYAVKGWNRYECSSLLLVNCSYPRNLKWFFFRLQIAVGNSQVEIDELVKLTKFEKDYIAKILSQPTRPA